ncbi:DUF779 domain-containing protein [Mucilaginibacter sp.]|uniref:DUF779 domain-containing protein n=1 Tax=Mucilaginibacter sp. TaxID=1882438 RepID=UPI00284C73C3|nr:DUF779 domain-containing protein [Mucilaginibacter sp.]MDR3697078.1 DUF779 domain-containing protein [Mucilaginibacter sp.]
MMESTARIAATPEAIVLIERLRKDHGDLMFHQSGGCCDGSQPMCFEKGEFRVGESDVYLGDVAGCGFFMNRDQFEYWQHTHLTLDVTKGRGSSFSLEIPLGLRFMIRSRLFSDEEAKHMVPVISGEAYLERK